MNRENLNGTFTIKPKNSEDSYDIAASVWKIVNPKLLSKSVQVEMNSNSTGVIIVGGFRKVGTFEIIE